MAGLANALTVIFELPYAWAIFYGPIAQLVERASYTRLVAGSIPARPTMKRSLRERIAAQKAVISFGPDSSFGFSSRDISSKEKCTP